MRWGRLPASHAGQIMIDALGERTLWFLSIGRFTFIWETSA